jgi:hypothetical protein
VILAYIPNSILNHLLPIVSPQAFVLFNDPVFAVQVQTNFNNRYYKAHWQENERCTELLCCLSNSFLGLSIVYSSKKFLLVCLPVSGFVIGG